MAEAKDQILYISYDGLTDPLGESQILPYLAGIKPKVNEIHILSSEKKHRFENNEERIKRHCEQFQLNWHPIPYSKNPPFISTFLDVMALKRHATRIVKKHNIKLIHCRSYVACYVGYQIWKKYGIPYVFDMRGFWANERADGAIWNLNNPFIKRIYQFVKSLESNMLQGANHVISLTNNGKNELLSWDIGLKKEDISVIPCCVDQKLFSKSSIDPTEVEELKTKLLNDSSFVLGYSGSIGTWYLLNEMLSFYQVLRQHIPNCRFLFLTPDEPKSILKKAAELDIPDHELVIKSCKRFEMPSHLALMDVAIFFIKPKYSKIASSPTKFAEFMSMGIPVVCNDGIGDMKSYFENYHPGILLEQLNNEEYNSASSEIMQLKSISKGSLNDIAIKEFSLEMGIQSYINVYHSILNDDTSRL